jgi:hypothetical protein
MVELMACEIREMAEVQIENGWWPVFPIPMTQTSLNMHKLKFTIIIHKSLQMIKGFNFKSFNL